MTEDFETEEDYDRGEFGTQGSQSIGTRDWDHEDATPVEVIGDELEPSNGRSSIESSDDYREANVVDVPSDGSGNSGEDSSGGILDNITRRQAGAGILTALGITGAGAYALSDGEDSQTAESTTTAVERTTIDDLLDRQYDQVESIPGPYETDSGIIDLGQYADEMPDMREGEVGQRILRTQNSDLYDDMADESEWNDVFRQAGDTGLMLEEDGSVFAYNETAQVSRRLDSQDFNTGGEAYEGEEGESFEALYEELV